MVSWSSKQRLNRKDRLSLAKDLLALSIELQNKRLSTLDIMKTLEDMTLDITLKDILINHTKD